MNLSSLGLLEDALNPLDISYMFLSVTIAFIFSRGFMIFILVGVYDFRRRKLLLAQCSALVSHVDKKNFCMKLNIYKIDITNVSSVLSWYHMRSAFLDFGKRYTLRIFLYTSLILPVCVCVIVGLFLMLFDVIG